MGALTNQYCPTCSNFLVSSGKVKKNVGKSIISFWLWAFSNEAYRSAFDGGCTTVKAKAHEVKGISASVLLKKNFVVQQVVKVGTWDS